MNLNWVHLWSLSKTGVKNRHCLCFHHAHRPEFHLWLRLKRREEHRREKNLSWIAWDLWLQISLPAVCSLSFKNKHIVSEKKQLQDWKYFSKAYKPSPSIETHRFKLRSNMHIIFVRHDWVYRNWQGLRGWTIRFILIFKFLLNLF